MLSGMRLERLPGWVVDNDTSVRREVSPYIGMTMAERWEVTRRCCRSARSLLRFHGDPQRALDHCDRLPESSIRALERLRAAAVTR